jgi:hypothetical protein
MPYEIREVPGDGFEVINSETKEVKSKKTTREEAERQVRLLHAVENDPNWEPQNA